MKKLLSSILPLILLLAGGLAAAQSRGLLSKIEAAARPAKGKTGVAILDIETGDSLSYNGQGHFPMQSVFKLPIALTVLHAVEDGRLSLAQKIHLGREAMARPTWSPIRQQYPNGNIDLSIADLLAYMVSQSDNIACDLLLKELGGPQIVEAYMHGVGIGDISIKASEADMAKAWSVQYTNWCTPVAMAGLLAKVQTGSLLLPAHRAFLLKLLQTTSTGQGRIKGLLPDGTVLAHKTGSSDTNKAGMTAATNDAGIITLPNGHHLVVVVFVSDALADEATREAVIARIAKLAFDHFSR